jgi:hypothetical protein
MSKAITFIELDIVDDNQILDAYPFGADITHVLDQLMDGPLTQTILSLTPKVELVTPCGPGGGNPVVRFWGTREGVNGLAKVWDQLEEGTYLG